MNEPVFCRLSAFRSSETPARYREWVETNRRRVHDATGGRVGYVHIPDMGARGYAEFHRGYLAEVAETVHGERGGLERALNFYRRAWLLNRSQEHPDNRANLDLNIGNILGQATGHSSGNGIHNSLFLLFLRTCMRFR